MNRPTKMRIKKFGSLRKSKTMSTTAQLSTHSRATLTHLQHHYPQDGYSIERYLSNSNKNLVRLKRRNVPLHDEGFLDFTIHNNAVVGLQVLTAKGDAGRGVIVITSGGKICNVDKGGEVVTVDMKQENGGSKLDRGSSFLSSMLNSTTSNNTSSSSVKSSSTSRTSTNSQIQQQQLPLPPLSDEDTQLLLKYGLAALCGIFILKSIINLFSSVSFLLPPLLYLYATQSCPSVESFDAKQQLKRVLRGAHLPEQEQPQGSFWKGLNRIVASIETELATSLGYEQSVEDYWGAVRVVWVRVPVVGLDFCWVGAFGKWRYLFQKEIPGSNSNKKND